MRGSDLRQALRRSIVSIPLLLLIACGGGGSGGGEREADGGADGGADRGEVANTGEPGDASTDMPGQAGSAVDINVSDRAMLRPGGTLRLPIFNIAENWNPLHVDGNNKEYSDLLEPLLPVFFDFDAEGIPTPNSDYLLSAEEISQSPTVIRYVLNPDAVWGDGSPIDGDDMKAVWQACNGEDPSFNCASTESYSPIADITMDESKREVTVSYRSTFPDWSQGFSIPGVLKAESIADADAFNDGWKSLDNDVLSGPFKVGDFDRTEQVMTLVPNERWWGMTPLLEKVVWRVIASDARAQAFANDEIDAFDIGSDPDAFQRATRVADAEVRKAGGPNFRHFTFNSRAGLLEDLAIRQAIVLGLDRASIAASDLAGIDWPATPLNNHIFLQAQTGYVDTAELTGLDYNPDEAKARLDAAGWVPGADGIREKDGQPLVVRFTQLATVKASENEALQTQSQLKDIGIQVDIVTVPTSRFGATLTGHEFEIIAFSWIGTPYPFSGIKQIYGTGSESNFAQLSIPEVDSLAERIAVESDPAARIALANEVDRIIWENVHTLPLYQRPELIATDAKLANFGAFGLSSPVWENIGFLE